MKAQKNYWYKKSKRRLTLAISVKWQELEENVQNIYKVIFYRQKVVKLLHI